MLDPTFLDGCSSGVVDLFSEVENEILSDIVRRIEKSGIITSTAQWQYEKAQAVGLLQGDVKGYLADSLSKSRREISGLFKEAALKSISVDDAIYAKAGIPPISLFKSDAMKAILLQGTKSTVLMMRNFTKTTAKAADMALYNSLDKAFMLTHIGAYDYNRAIRQAVNELARQGIVKTAYPSGHIDSTETSVRRAVLTGLNQTCAELQLYRADDVGCDLVEVTEHLGARPSHAEWQGQVYSLSGKKKGYGNFRDETGYGTGDGLCGWNCRHSFFPYYEGISGRTFTALQTRQAIAENERIYNLTQKQRYYERQIRAAKTECVALDNAVRFAANDEQEKMFKEDFAAASVKLKRRETHLTIFLSENSELNRQREREWKGGFNRSVSAKAVWADRKSK